MKDGKLGFKEKLKTDVERVTNSFGFQLGTLYLALTIAANAVAFPIAVGFNGLERLIGADKKQTTVTLVDKGYIKLHHGGALYWGTFEKENGEKIKLYDNFDILSGKFFTNTKLPKAEVGKSYELESLEGPISDKVIDLD